MFFNLGCKGTKKYINSKKNVFRGIAGEVSVPREAGEPKGVKMSPVDAR